MAKPKELSPTTANKRAERCRERFRTHGWSKTRTYHSWLEMRRRCLDPNRPAYKHYGGRGILICDRFENFLLDMGEAPVDMSLERVNNDKGYEPDNCKWATAKEQANNTRRNVRFEYRGRIYNLTQLAALSGVNFNCLYRRLLKLGWDLDRALTTPVRKCLRNQVSSPCFSIGSFFSKSSG